MSQPLPHTLTDLPRDAMLRIADRQAHVIVVFEGQLWLTQDGDPRDVILEAGDSFSFDSHGVTLVQALRAARLLVSNPAALEPVRAVDAQVLQLRARALRDAAVAALIARGLAGAQALLSRAAQRLSASVSAARRPLRTSGAGA